MGTAQQGGESVLAMLSGDPNITADSIDSDLARFASKLVVEDHGHPQGPCLTWRAALRDGKYGNFKAKGVARRAHLWIREHVIGPIEAGMTVDHLCRNTRCCNPWHGEQVTRRENVLRELAARREMRAMRMAA
jgi:hypothetical protein